MPTFSRLEPGLLRFALFGLALWFFGNLYEQIVLMPNWVVAPLDVLRAYNRYYTVVIQYHYYVPATQLAVVALLVLGYRTARGESLRAALLRAGWWGAAGVALTVPIVWFLNTDLFLGDLTLSEAQAHRLGWYWMGGNLLRLACVALALRYALRAYVEQRRSFTTPSSAA